MFAFGVLVCGISARKLGVHDHGGIVWDEFVGYFVTMVPVVAVGAAIERSHMWVWVVVGFLLFRIFDVFKPPGARWSDKNVHGGLGIMLDDFIASLYSAAAMWLLLLASFRFF
jgi:phosphatidylglycerophosphatase A